MGTGMLAITLCPELVALITRPAYSPPDGTGHARASCRPIRVLPVLRLLLGAGPRQVRVVYAYVLLQLLQGVVGALGERVEAPGVQVTRRNVGIREESRGRYGVVGWKPVQRVGQHVGRPVGVRAALW